jgi:hypothetical protein
MASAHTNEDLPVPFGPRITFRRGPGSISTSLYVMKLCSFTFITLPGMYSEGWCRAPCRARFAAGVTADGPAASSRTCRAGVATDVIAARAPETRGVLCATRGRV